MIMELDFGWTSEAEMSMIVHPMPHQAWLATPVVEVLSKLIVVKVGASSASAKGQEFRPYIYNLSSLLAKQHFNASPPHPLHP